MLLTCSRLFRENSLHLHPQSLSQHFERGDHQLFVARQIAGIECSQPAGQVHPLSLKYLAEKGVPTQGLKSQSWDDFEVEQPDIVVTVCDSAAAEACPVWFGETAKVHWGLPDPSKLQGSEVEIRDAFYAVMATTEQRVHKLLELNLESLTTADRQIRLDQLIQEQK